MEYIIPLVITILIETMVAFIMGLNSKKLYGSIVLVNIITNPLLNFIINHYSIDFPGIIIGEIVVIILEALMLKFLVKGNLPFGSISFVINAVSFLIGLWLPWNIIWGVLK